MKITRHPLRREVAILAVAASIVWAGLSWSLGDPSELEIRGVSLSPFLWVFASVELWFLLRAINWSGFRDAVTTAWPRPNRWSTAAHAMLTVCLTAGSAFVLTLRAGWPALLGPISWGVLWSTIPWVNQRIGAEPASLVGVVLWAGATAWLWPRAWRRKSAELDDFVRHATPWQNSRRAWQHCLSEAGVAALFFAPALFVTGAMSVVWSDRNLPGTGIVVSGANGQPPAALWAWVEPLSAFCGIATVWLWLWRRRAEALRPVGLFIAVFAVVVAGMSCGNLPASQVWSLDWQSTVGGPLVLVLWLYLRTVTWTAQAWTWRGVARETALFLLAAALALLGVLTALAVLPDAVARSMIGLGRQTADTEKIFLFFAFPIGLGATLLLWAWLRHWRAWRSLAALGAITLAVLLHLTWDDPDILPLPATDRTAETPLASESDAVFRSLKDARFVPSAWARLATVHPQWRSVWPTEFDRWRLFVSAHRRAIQEDWTAASAARQWISDLDRFDVIGDREHFIAGRNRDTNELISTLRKLSALHFAYATLQAIDGQHDQAIESLQPLLRVSRKLQPAARFHVRLVLGRVVQNFSQETIRGILRSGALHPDTLEHLAAALRPESHPGADGVRVLLAEIQTEIRPRIQDSVRGSLSLGWLGRFLYLPRATENLVIRQRSAFATALTEGRGEDFRSFGRSWFLAKGLRNPVGRLLAADDDGPVQILRAGWQIEDRRRTLLAEVQANLAAPNTASTPAKMSAP